MTILRLSAPPWGRQFCKRSQSFSEIMRNHIRLALPISPLLFLGRSWPRILPAPGPPWESFGSGSSPSSSSSTKPVSAACSSSGRILGWFGVVLGFLGQGRAGWGWLCAKFWDLPGISCCHGNLGMESWRPALVHPLGFQGSFHGLSIPGSDHGQGPWKVLEGRIK